VANKRSVLPEIAIRGKSPVLWITFGLVVSFHGFLLLAMPGAALAARPTVHAGVDTVDDPAEERADPAAARQLFQLLNRDRAQAGLPSLAWDDGLAAAALKHTQLMARRRQLTHQFAGEPPLPQRVTAVPLDLSGENVAINVTIPDANTGLMNSPPHRANILSGEFNAVGIGIVWKDSQVWVTQDFARRIESLSDEAAEDMVATAFARTRARAGLPSLPRIGDRHLSALACDMGHQDHLDTGKALKSTTAMMATAFTTSKPGELSETAAQAAVQRNAQRYGVGVCFRQSSSYPSGVYWVLLVLYAR
jgi:uncharacterized protein YkwD